MKPLFYLVIVLYQTNELVAAFLFSYFRFVFQREPVSDTVNFISCKLEITRSYSYFLCLIDLEEADQATPSIYTTLTGMSLASDFSHTWRKRLLYNIIFCKTSENLSYFSIETENLSRQHCSS